ncbi:MAG TPA: galactokinase [Burkholderiales bacterium]|nr:galactokinase [Burkholderiales bacterium]
MQDITNKLTKQFNQLFTNDNAKRLFFAPGRVNLIGEHTDYNGGNVFPCALDIGTYALVAARQDNLCRFYSLNFPAQGIIEFEVSNLEFNTAHNWANYPKGVMVEFIKNGATLSHGFDVVFYGNIPNGAGLSSSASIEVLMGTILNDYLGTAYDSVKIALIGQAAENKYIGVGCGIMDQFASAMGRENHAILLDCNSLNYQYAPLNIAGYKLVIANTNKQRGLADSKYNERLAECREALKLLQSRLTINALGELSVETLEKNSDLFTNQTIYQRARHAVAENQRTLTAVEALHNNDLVKFGELMKQSHISLRDDYAVTGKELDALVSAAWQHSGCIGARMTGAGFGGCTVNLVKADSVEDFIKQVGAEYRKQTNLIAEFYVVSPGDGARKLKEPASRWTAD